MPAENYIITDASNVPGWRTTAPDNQIEIWKSPGANGIASADEGDYFAELNANLVSTLFQDVNGIAAGSVIGWKLSHRGRTGVDMMSLTITDLGVDGMAGTADDTMLFTRTFSDGTTWGRYSGTNIVALGNPLRFAFDSLSAAGGIPSEGNFLDAADFGVGVGVTPAVPEPTTLAMWLAGLLATAGFARRSRSA